MKRRDFVRTGLAAGLAAAAPLAAHAACADPTPAVAPTARQQHDFKLKYAPHFGMFRHHAGDDLLDQIRFGAEVGFRAWEDNGMKGRTPEMQAAIGEELAKHGMQMGVFVAHNISWNEPSLTSGDPELREAFLNDIRGSVEVAKRCNATWMTVVPGHLDLGLEMDYQTANVVEALRRASDILEPHGLTMVLEPLNHFANHAGQFLAKIPQAYLICRAVDSPACKILFDIYHQQIQQGNLIPNIDMAWGEIGYFQIGDNPGRKEPTTGEINYINVFRHIHQKGWDGVLGMEHGNSLPGKEGEQAVIDAYVVSDAFTV